jgi:far upstream element-binding protein
LVIGTKGDTIKAIQQQSGARVQLIQEAPPNSPYKIFILQGTPQQLASAKALIMEKVTGMVGAQPAYPLSPWPQQAYQQSPQAFPQYAQQQQYAYAAYTQYPQQVQSPQSWNGQYVQPSAAAAMQTQQPPTPSQQAYYAQAPSQSPMPQSQGVNGYGAGGDLGTPGQHSQESLQSQDPNQSLSASAEEATLDGSLSAVGELTLEQQWQNWYAWQAYYAQQGITSAQPQQQQQYTTSAGYYQPQAQQQTDSLPPPPPPSV